MDQKKLALELSQEAAYLVNAQNHLPTSYDWHAKVESALEDLLHALRKNEDCQLERNELKKLKGEYQTIYLSLHDKTRLNATEDNKRNALLSDGRLDALRKLSSIDLLSAQPVDRWQEDINKKKACWTLTKEKLEHSPICTNVNCRYRPKDESFVQNKTLEQLDEELEAILVNWTETLLTNFNDPDIKDNLEYLREEHKSLIEEFIARKEISLPVNLKLIDAINELLQGIEKVSISVHDLEQMMNNGNPLTVDELKRRFDTIIEKTRLELIPMGM